MKKRRFAPSAFAIILTLVGVALFLRLGWWQLQRAEQKAALVAQFEVGARRTVLLNAANAASLARYQQVAMRGRYESERQILIDNMPSSQGRPGYRVLTPFLLDSGAWILVDRGWIASGPRREVLPDVAVAENVRALHGRLDQLPRPGLRLAQTNVTAEGPWPRVLNFPEHAQLERALDRALLPGLILLDEAEPDGFERRWQMHFRVEPERHVAYAVQWFAFALVAVVLFVIVSVQRSKNDDEPSA